MHGGSENDANITSGAEHSKDFYYLQFDSYGFFVPIINQEPSLIKLGQYTELCI